MTLLGIVRIHVALGDAEHGESPGQFGVHEVVFRGQARVSDDETALVEDDVGGKTREEIANVRLKGVWVPIEFGDRFLETVDERRVSVSEMTFELQVVVAWHGQRDAGFDHAHHQSQNAGIVRSAVDEVADEHRESLVGRTPTGGVALPVPERGEQVVQLIEAGVNVADDVEGSRAKSLINRGVRMIHGPVAGRTNACAG
jgi:hypothetical protein